MWLFRMVHIAALALPALAADALEGVTADLTGCAVLAGVGGAGGDLLDLDLLVAVLSGEAFGAVADKLLFTEILANASVRAGTGVKAEVVNLNVAVSSGESRSALALESVIESAAGSSVVAGVGEAMVKNLSAVLPAVSFNALARESVAVRAAGATVLAGVLGAGVNDHLNLGLAELPGESVGADALEAISVHLTGSAVLARVRGATVIVGHPGKSHSDEESDKRQDESKGPHGCCNVV